MTEDEVRSGWLVLHRSFGWPLADADSLVQDHDRDDLLFAFAGTEVVATAGVHPFGAWFGGSRVPMGGVFAVAVPPEHRGRGLATRLMAAALPFMRDRGEAISGLYPATTALYRGAGWELAGTWSLHGLPVDRLDRVAASAGGQRARRAGPDDREAIERCYGRQAPRHDGWLDRHDRWWRRILERPPERRHVFVVDGRGDEIAGYVACRFLPADRPWGFNLQVDELVADDAEASGALWAIVRSCSTMSPTIAIVGPLENPLRFQLDEQDLTLRREIRWMLRVVDVAAALEARGYPDGFEARVTLDVEDRHAPWNSGRWTLEVESGKAHATRTSVKGAAALDVAALASLFSGYADPADLVHAGRLRQATDAHVGALRAMFSGPTPWTPDFY